MVGDAATRRAAELSDAAVAGDRLALARLLTAVENRTPVAEAALRQLYPMAGRAHLVGITGPPGSGKSTLVAALIAEVRAAGRPVAVIAVDPSSPITGGALLGDRVRMQAYAGDDGVFIRSMASRGHAGGLAATSTAAAAVLDAAGFDLILIETVGTGQSEVEVAAAADTTVVLEAPEMGDEVQAIKAGLLEVADLVVVNKGDKPGAQRTAAQLRAMLVASAPRVEDGSPTAQAARGADHDGRHRGRSTRSSSRRWTGIGLRAAKDLSGAARLARAEAQVWAIVAERLHGRLHDAKHSTSTKALLDDVAEHRLDPYSAADVLLEELGPVLICDPSGPSAAVGPPIGCPRDGTFLRSGRSCLVTATHPGSELTGVNDVQDPPDRP